MAVNDAQPRDDVETRLAVVETILNEHGRRLDRLEAKMDRLLYVFIGVGVTIVVTMLGAMAAGFWAVLAALAG